MENGRVLGPPFGLRGSTWTVKVFSKNSSNNGSNNSNNNNGSNECFRFWIISSWHPDGGPSKANKPMVTG